MFGSATLEIAIGIIFVFILVSTICTAIREGIESWLKTRAAYLEHGIRQLLNDKEGTGLAKDLYNHPMIFGLFNGPYKSGSKKDDPAILARGKNLPSYIPSKNFAIALMDIAARGPASGADSTDAGAPIVSLDAIRNNLNNFKNPQIRWALQHAVDTAQGDMNKLQANIEAWFNSSMDRVSGWYKRSTQWILFVIAMFVAVGLNINCIKIANYLSHDEAARKIIIEKAGAAAKDSTTVNKNYTDAKADLQQLDLPMGWGDGCKSAWLNETDNNSWNNIWGPLLGWLIIAFAATLGAPFWFDMMNKVMTLRSTIKPAEATAAAAPAGAPATPQVVYITGQPGGGQATADTTEDHDGCSTGAALTTITSDEDLPEAKGGVA